MQENPVLRFLVAKGRWRSEYTPKTGHFRGYPKTSKSFAVTTYENASSDCTSEKTVDFPCKHCVHGRKSLL